MQYLLTKEELDNHRADEIASLKERLREWEKRMTPEDCPHNYKPPESAPRSYCSGCPLSSFPNGSASDYRTALCTKVQHYPK